MHPTHRLARVVLFGWAVATAGTLSAADWTHWRGPNQTGAVSASGLPDRFGTDPTAPDSNLIWKAPYGCRSTPAILGDRVFVINSDGEGLNEGERVMAFDAKTGKVLWEHKFNVFHTDIVSSRVGWANVAADAETGYVYAHGVQGLMWCLDGANGKVVWSHSLTEEFGRVTGYGGRVVSPVVEGDLVVVGMINASWGDQARGNNRFVAFDKRTGAVRWWSSPCELNKLTYNSIPVAATINGQRLLITGTADGAVTAIQANTGAKVWQYMFGAQAINSSPVVDGNLVYITHGQENIDQATQGRVICLDASQVTDGKPKLVWEEVGVKSDLSSPLLVDGKLYVPDDGATLYCFDAKTGKRLWKHKYGKVARAAPVFADGKIWIAEVNSKFHILKPGDKRCTDLAEVPFFSGRGVSTESSGTAAVSNGRVYFGTETDFYCVGKKDWTPEGKAPAGVGKVTMPPSQLPPALALVVPGDVALRPGESATFTVKLYDKNGDFIRDEAKCDWSLPLPAKTPSGAQPPALVGTIENGKLTVSKSPPPGQTGMVEAKVGTLTARARVRVAPALPYKLDLSKVPVGSTPGGWVNAQGKYAVVEVDGKKLIKKLAENAAPPVARANAYITLPDAANYTIQADVSGSQANNNMPDMGIVNSRYTLQMNGNKQQLRLLSWEAVPRLDKTIDFPWKAGEWYTLKLTIQPMGGKSMILGKAWPRGTPEPDKWTIEVEDTRPNPGGSPALYGYATGILAGKVGAEAFYDNIAVTPNK
ncbi:MAG: PQQ-like beta-propeller repeat protein [Gemmataceae bacterium]|nr:PQQ-like beta-propeller repeat protein [Gemmataceae bacterium]